ncbi:MAG: L-aspartate oxidase [Halobacteriota archaeon]
MEVEHDVVVVGSGVAGCSAALRASEDADVGVVTKATKPEQASTTWAQGGIASVAPDEAVEDFVEDVVEASAGAADRDAVESLVSDAEDAVDGFLRDEVGVEFDVTDGDPELAREGGHSSRRVLHRGDATGREIHLALLRRLDGSNATVYEGHTAVDLLERGDGVLALDGDGAPVVVRGRATLLATGGVGDVYGETTNPRGTTGDGVALAAYRGAEIRDMEYVQFHPTAHAERGFLLTEALRGEGALVVDGDGERFLEDVHDDAELAPRHVVAAAIDRRRREGEVYLDIRPVTERHDLSERFPTAAANLTDDERESGLVPVKPVEHFLCGGVAVDERGRSTREGLYAAGEVARTGVHGANRLASTSLLEGVVYGLRAGESAVEDDVDVGRTSVEVDSFNGGMPEGFVESKFDRLQDVMWENVGLRRDEAGLRRAVSELRRLRGEVRSYARGRLDAELYELRNAVVVGALIAEAALANEETRGCHVRVDA